MRRAIFTLVSICWYFSGCPGAVPKYSLPDTVIPLRQAVEITIDPAQDHLSGIARLSVRIDRPQAEIWVNGRDLSIREAHIETPSGNQPLKAEKVSNEFLRLVPAKPVAGRDLVLVIAYQAPLAEEKTGDVRTTAADSSTGPYRAKTGSDWYAFTTFTPADARRAFPCFDEPRFKTPWELSFRIREGHKAFTNTPQTAETLQADGWKLVRFAETRPLPAEVIAFAVGPFDLWQGAPAGEKAIPVRVLTARGDARLGEQAALETKDILVRLEHYTGIPYPWEKLDHVALPRSAFGAVENPGLITYNGNALLTGAGEGNAAKKHAIRALEAHEIAHQWFGNLVTQASWTDVWLSEGFATWLSARTMDEEEPGDRKRLAAIVNRERIMLVDDGPETIPVRLPRQTREELRSVYNRIVYQKGAALLMVVENWIGPHTMQKGLRDYLAAHALANATTEDLEASLKAVSKQDPTAVMNGFLNSTGVPRVSAEVRCGAAPAISLKRQRGSAPVPVCYHAGSTRSCAVVADSVVNVPLAACPAFLYPNGGGAGYFRTIWTAEQLKQLRPSLGKLDGAERLTLVYDLWAMRNPPSPEVDSLLKLLAEDRQPEIVHAAKVALGLEKEEEPSHHR